MQGVRSRHIDATPQGFDEVESQAGEIEEAPPPLKLHKEVDVAGNSRRLGSPERGAVRSIAASNHFQLSSFNSLSCVR